MLLPVGALVRCVANDDGFASEHVRVVQMDSLYSSRFSWIVTSRRDLRVRGLSSSGATGCHLPGTKTCDNLPGQGNHFFEYEDQRIAR